MHRTGRNSDRSPSCILRRQSRTPGVVPLRIAVEHALLRPTLAAPGVEAASSPPEAPASAEPPRSAAERSRPRPSASRAPEVRLPPRCVPLHVLHLLRRQIPEAQRLFEPSRAGAHAPCRRRSVGRRLRGEDLSANLRRFAAFASNTESPRSPRSRRRRRRASAARLGAVPARVERVELLLERVARDEGGLHVAVAWLRCPRASALCGCAGPSRACMSSYLAL